MTTGTMPRDEWLTRRRCDVLALARESGVTVRDRAASYMAANKARELVGRGQ